MKVGTDALLLGAYAIGIDGQPILDIGCGTGIVTLMMAQRFGKSRVDGVEIDTNAAMQAKENAAASPFADRICIYNADIQQFKSGITAETIGNLRRHDSEKYSTIVCNPPFFVNSLTCPNDARTTARHAGALTFDVLSHAAYRLLNYDGKFTVIIPTECFAALESAAIISGFFLEHTCHVYTAVWRPPKRIVATFTNAPVKQTTTATITIGSDEYRNILSDFKPLDK